MKALVSGATGFLGSNLVSALLEQKYEVTTFSRKRPTASWIDNTDWMRADITCRETLESVFAKKYDVFFHLAGLVSFNQRNVKELMDVNDLGVGNVYAKAVQSKIPRVVHVSSAATIGPVLGKDPATEKGSFEWNSAQFPYNHSKYLGEQRAIAMAKDGHHFVVVNPSFIFGEGDDHSPAMHLLQKLKKRKLPLYPSGGACIVWVRDVVRGMILASQKGRRGERYILGGENVENKKAYQFIASTVGGIRPFLPIPSPLLYAYGALAECEAAFQRKPARFTRAWARAAGINHYYSSRKAEEELGYTKVGFEETIQRTVTWMKSKHLF